MRNPKRGGTTVKPRPRSSHRSVRQLDVVLPRTEDLGMNSQDDGMIQVPRLAAVLAQDSSNAKGELASAAIGTQDAAVGEPQELCLDVAEFEHKPLTGPTQSA